MRSVHSRRATAPADRLGIAGGCRGGSARGGNVGGGSAVHEVVEHVLREGAAAHLDEALDREALDGLEDLRRLTALGEHVGEDGVADRVFEPGGDRRVGGERRGAHDVFLSTGQQCPVLGYTRATPDKDARGLDRGPAPDPRRAGAESHGLRPGPRRAGARPNRGPAAGPGNRAALIAAAREVYAVEGLSAPFSAVAKRAGVGQGSLYRHFPDRTALAVAVFEENLIDLEEFTAPPDRTIDDLLDRVVAQAMVATAFIDLIAADLHDPRVAPLGIRFRAVVSRLLARERRGGMSARTSRSRT